MDTKDVSRTSAWTLSEGADNGDGTWNVHYGAMKIGDPAKLKNRSLLDNFR